MLAFIDPIVNMFHPSSIGSLDLSTGSLDFQWAHLIFQTEVLIVDCIVIIQLRDVLNYDEMQVVSIERRVSPFLIISVSQTSLVH